MDRQIGGVKRRLCLVLTLLLLSGVAQAQVLNVYVGQGQMPFADGPASRPGIFAELMSALCARAGFDCRLRSVPWRRVLSEAQDDPQAVVLNMGRIAEREHSFLWLLNVLPTAYVLASTQNAHDSLEQALEAGPVAVMSGTPRANELLAARQGGQEVVEVTDPEQAAHLMRVGRLAAWYEIDLRISYLWKRLGNAEQPLLTGRPIATTDSYIAGSLKLENAASVQQRLDAAFREMQADGSWQRILEHYLPPEGVERLLHAK